MEGRRASRGALDRGDPRGEGSGEAARCGVEEWLPLPGIAPHPNPLPAGGERVRVRGNSGQR
ncbi:hypothetical protein CN131_13685 [Sinorhizobium meliloti]|nr:hypothetical protein CN144_17345 [Sinorhizobium meliloti]RVL92357.1 hypothetical protein CN131_13685 [Sinorhizobium meliloti]